MNRSTQRILRIAGVGGVTAALAATTACAGGGGGSGTTTLEYWMWDDVQLPAYEQCAADFTEENPDIEVEITQTAWGQYWTNLATQLAAGSAPDVWTNQSSYYPQFVADNQVEDLQPYIDEAGDAVDLDQYVSGLADTWVVDGARYGLPKDWDTVALVFSREAVEAAGIDAASLQELTWNPDDGGTFGEVIAQLTVDANGVRGNEPGFDPSNVETYGFLPEWTDGSEGQNMWGNFAHMNGFEYADVNPFGEEFNYDAPELAETIDWFAGLSDQGYAPALDIQSSLWRIEVLMSGAGAMTTLGAFNQMTFADAADDYIFAPLPTGPEGRKSAINGLSDAMYAGSDNKDAAWKWIQYLASPECQNVVGETGVVFPAVQEASDRSVEVRAESGLDAEVFFTYLDDPEGTFLIPVANNGTEMAQIVQDAIQSVALGSTDAQTALTEANEKVNALFQ
jgi:multiple sugar transport system substrate-binding protein